MSAQTALKPAIEPIDEIRAEGPFYISAEAPQTRARHTLKQGDTFIVLDNHGDIGATAGATTDGLFCRDTRFLSRLELLVSL